MKLNDDIKWVYGALLGGVFSECTNGKERHRNYNYAEDDFLLLLADIFSGMPRDSVTLSYARNMFINLWGKMLNMQSQFYPTGEDMVIMIKRNASATEVDYCINTLSEFTEHITSLLDCKGKLYGIDLLIRLFMQ